MSRWKCSFITKVPYQVVIFGCLAGLLAIGSQSYRTLPNLTETSGLYVETKEKIAEVWYKDELVSFTYDGKVGVPNIKGTFLIEGRQVKTTTALQDSSMIQNEEQAKPIAKLLYEHTKTDKQFMLATVNWIRTNLTYSTKDYIDEMYKPDISVILARRYGVCTDYAALFTAIMHQANIPCNMVYGYKDGNYHAWCRVKIENEWVDIDPTTNGNEYIPKYIF